MEGIRQAMASLELSRVLLLVRSWKISSRIIIIALTTKEVGNGNGLVEFAS